MIGCTESNLFYKESIVQLLQDEDGEVIRKLVEKLDKIFFFLQEN